MKPIRDWFHRTFSNQQIIILTSLLLIGLVAIIFIADMIAPVIAALIIALLLDGPVQWMTRRGVPHILSVSVTYFSFFLAALLVLLGLLPILFGQMANFVEQVPTMTQQLQEHLVGLPAQYPEILTEEQVNTFMTEIGANVISIVSTLPSFAGASVVGLLTAIVYLVLILVLVFFMVKDKKKVMRWIVSFLPHERELTSRVWNEIHAQVYNYMRGKFWEILIVGAVTWVSFSLLGVNFSILLAFITGFSVLIPYVGAAAVTIPVAVIALVQYGIAAEMLYVLAVYGIIQALDGNILAPLLFSEVVNLHPIAIIVAILVFGGIWGFWGVFFAIPLATVVQAVLRAWPRSADNG